ncbi:MAG: HD-GYP domain-containing protein [Actinomycetota bacterium]
MRAATGTRMRALLPQAIIATAGVVVVPVLITLAMVLAGLPDPEYAVATGVGLFLAMCAAALGSTLWLRRDESVEVSFGELMLWRWLRRHRAEQKIQDTAEILVHPVRTEVSDEDRIGMLHELTTALEIKDPYTHGHSRRVERHAYRTGLALGLANHEIEELRLAASLHDVGKIDIPDHILRKPGPLTDAELDVIRAHPVTGAELVAPAASETVVAAIRHHHERWDGFGYPNGLQAEEIPLGARIIAVADAYDAITSARPYKTGSARRDAVAMLEAGAGVQFDAEVVKAFISTLPSAIPALASLLLLAWPARMARKTAVWAKSAGAGSMATAAASAGMAALIGTAGINTVQQRLPETSPSWPSTASIESFIGDAGDTEVGGIRLTQKAAKPKEVRRDRPAKDADDPTVAIDLLPADGPPPSEPAGPDDREPEVPVGAAADDDKYEPFGDPQPEHGQECEKAKGKGLDKHCG